MSSHHLTQLSFRPSSRLRDATAKIFAAPGQLLRAVQDAASRSREAAQVRAASAALDPRLLRDIGLRRSLVDRSELYRPQFPCT